MHFEFTTSPRILFGSGVMQEIAPHAKLLGSNVFAVVDRCVPGIDAFTRMLRKEGLSLVLFHGSGEPTIRSVMEAILQARELRCDMVLGIGGGSVLDTAKAVAAMLTNPGDVADYLEVIGMPKPLIQPSAPWIAVPTTAGTGAEVTGNSVLASPEHRIKVSLRSPFMLPRLVAVDPDLTHTLPPDVTARSGLDALTQLIEPFVCVRPNPMTDALCQEGIPRIHRSLFRAYENGNDAVAREDMSLAALFSGMALSNAKLGAVHGIAGPLGGMIPVPHGTACARLLPCVMEVNASALKSRSPDAPARLRYWEIAVMLTDNPEAAVLDGIACIRKLVRDMKVPKLADFGLVPSMFADLIGKAKKASSMKGNPIELTDEELKRILEMEARL